MSKSNHNNASKGTDYNATKHFGLGPAKTALNAVIYNDSDGTTNPLLTSTTGYKRAQLAVSNAVAGGWDGQLDIIADKINFAKTNGTVTEFQIDLDANVVFKANQGVGGTGDPSLITLDDKLQVNKATTLSSTLAVTDATTLSSTLAVTGASTLESSLSVGSTLDVHAAATLSSTLAVTDATTLSSTLAVTGASTLTSTLSVGNNLKVAGTGVFDKTLQVTGNTSIAGTFSLGKDVITAMTLQKTLSVEGVIRADNGGIAGSGGWQTDSDRRLKKDIKTLDDAEVLDRVINIRSVQYVYKNANPPRLKYGFIAQELLELIPTIVNTDNPERFSVNYSELVIAIPMLAREIQKLKAEIAELKK